jgi:hypothetical protein
MLLDACSLLAAAVCWMLLLLAAAGCYCWMLLLDALLLDAAVCWMDGWMDAAETVIQE